MADQDLLIKIVTKAELAGAQALAEANDREIGRLKVLASSIDDVAKREAALDQIRQRSAANARQRATVEAATANQQRIQAAANESVARIERAKEAAAASRAALQKRIQTAAGLSASEANARVNVGSIGQQSFGLLGAKPEAPAAAGGFAKLGQSLATFGLAVQGAYAQLRALETAFRVTVLAAEESRVSEERLGAALRSQGFEADALLGNYKDLAQQLQGATGMAADEWMGILRQLTQYGSTPETIGMDAVAVKNLTGIMGDASAAAAAWGKAIAGDFESMKRYGIHVDEGASQTEKLRQAMQLLATKGAGQLEAGMSGLSGALAGTKNIAANFGEILGDQIIGKFDFAAKALSKLIGWRSADGGSVTGLGDAIKDLNVITEVWLDKYKGELPEVFDTAARSIGNTQQSAAEFQRAQDRLVNSVNRTNEALGRQVDSMRNVQRAGDEVADAQMALELSKVDAGERTGKTTADEAIRKRAEIRRRFAAARVARADDVDENEVIKNTNAIGTAEAALRQQREVVKDLEKQSRDGKGRDANEKLNIARKKLEEMQTATEQTVAQLKARNQELIVEMNARNQKFYLENQAADVNQGADLELAQREEQRQSLEAKREAASREAKSSNAFTAFRGRKALAQLEVEGLRADQAQTASPAGRAVLQERIATTVDQFGRDVAQSFESGDGKLAQGFAAATGALRSLDTTVSDGFERMVRTITSMQLKVEQLESRMANTR